ncbi:MAG TPA: hypothetical protein VFO06_09675 [Gemmatimonadales bacterium]|nr:hypothetical protein [Gemmatimonadales bacterium]
MSRIRLFILLASLALLPAGAQAQTTITACYVPKTGSVYRIQAAGAPDACKNGHVEFSWKAPAVVYGEITTVIDSFTVQPGALGVGGADCPAGSVAISGGFLSMDPYNGNFQVRMSLNHPQTPGWRVNGFNYGATPLKVMVQAYCAQVS